MHKSALLNKPILSEVLDVGYCVIPNFWSGSQCQHARQLIDQYLDTSKSNQTLEPIKVWVDKLGSDRRVMGVNHLNPELNLFDDPQINHIITSLYGVDKLIGFTMAAHLQALKGNLGSGQGWHRDSCVEHQYKAILYLSDVNKNTGPFQYYRKSGNSAQMVEFESKANADIDENRLDPYEDKFDFSQIDELCANEGSLIIANTRGIHRGKPMLSGNRYALTNYYWKQAIPEHITQYVNGIVNEKSIKNNTVH